MCVCVRAKAVTLENDKLRLQLSDRERALHNMQRSNSLLEHRLSVMSVRPSDVSLTTTDACQYTGAAGDDVDSLNQALRNIAREV